MPSLVLSTLLLPGEYLPLLIPSCFGASLIGLSKKDGGVRPIAIGCTLRRLAAKCCSMLIKDEMGLWLSPLQWGLEGEDTLLFKSRNTMCYKRKWCKSHGAEAAVHAARIYLSNIDEGHLLLKLDYSNAFNSVCHGKMLNAVLEKSSQIYILWFTQRIANHPISFLVFCRVTLWSPPFLPYHSLHDLKLEYRVSSILLR